MNAVQVGNRVKLLKSVWDDGADHHPPGWYAREGEELIVREVEGNGSRIAVSHDGVLDSSFLIFPDEFVVLN